MGSADAGPQPMTTTREIESKYEAPEGAATPSWPALAGLGASVGLSEELLEATYFDTPDLRLLADDLTLRRRTGGPDAGWHLKLPVGPDTRDEIHRPLGDAGAGPPDDLVALVRSRTRGGPLAPVAGLTTNRRRRQWKDEAGQLRVELVDDQVSARSSDGQHRAWRELEVELGPDADPGLLDVVEQALLDVGARRSPLPNKLTRALGSRVPAKRPAPPSPGRKASAAEVVLAYVAQQAAAMTTLDPAVRLDAPDAVHAMRVATRRMRSALQAFGDVIERDATRGLTTELKWLAGELGAARDLEVLRARVSAAVEALPADDVLGPVAARVARYFAPRQGEARAARLAALDSDRYLALLAAVDQLLAEPPLARAASKRATKVLPRLVAKAQRRVERHLRAADGLAPSDAGPDADVELHEARKAAKRVRYGAEAAEPVLGAPARRVVERAKAFQDLLGEHQDAVVARPVLREIALDAHAAGESAFTFAVLYGAGAPRPDPGELSRARRKLGKAVRRVQDGRSRR